MPIEPIVLRTLGTAQVDIGQAQVRPNAVRRFAALLYLSAEAGRRIPRRCLIDLLFPEQTERNGLHSLRELVYQLKSAGVGLDADQDGVELPGEAVRADYAELLAADRLTMDQIRAAQGGFLPGYAPHGSEAYKEWYEPFRAKAGFALSQVLLRDHARARDVGNLELSEAAARACLAISPLNERAIRALAETMALGGAKLQAVRLLEDYVAEVGGRSPDLKLSSMLMKQRFSERVHERYRSPGELPFAGREVEMLELKQRLAASRRGSTQRLVVLGEPGIGKTRIVNEFAAVAGLESSIARVTIQPSDLRRPMGVIVDLVPTLLQLPGALGIAPESMDALTRLTTRRSPSSSGEEPETVSRAITHALDDVLAATTAEGHVTLILEDLQWSDPLSIHVLAHLLTENRQLLVLITSRDRELRELGARFIEAATFLTLQPLDQPVATELAKRALHGTKGGDHNELHAWMAEIANGNPFYLSLLTAHFLASESAFTVPQTIHELLGKSLDALDPAATTVLQTCVLLASLATLPRVADALDLRYIDAVSSVSRLHEMRMLKLVDDKLQPSHALLAEALLQRSPELVRRMLHLRIAAILEKELDSAESTALLWHCAEHWVAAGEHGRALDFLARCAEHTNSIGRTGAAADILLRAASLQIDASTRAELLRGAIRWARNASELGLIAKAIEQLRQIDPAIRHDEVELAELHCISVTFRDAEGYEGRLRSCLESIDADSEHRVRAAIAALQYADAYSKPALAELVGRAVLEPDLSKVDHVLALEYRLIYDAVYGDPALGAQVARTLVGLVPSLPPARAAALQFKAAIALWRAGAPDEAMVTCERAHALAAKCGSMRVQFASALQSAGMLIDLGRPAESRAWRQRCANIQAENGHLQDGIELRALEIDFCLVEGSILEAEAGLQQTEELGLFNTPSRQRWRRCLTARLRQLGRGPALDDAEIEDFIERDSGSHPSSGIRDIEMAVVVAGLCAKGSRARAEAILEAFLEERVRHYRGPIARQLQIAILGAGFRIPTLLPPVSVQSI